GASSTSKTELVRSIGAEHVIDYTREDFADGRNRYDVILDIAGNRSLSELRRALTPQGTLVIVGAEDAGNWLGIRRQLRAAALSPFVRQKLGFFISKERRQDLEELRKLLAAGTIRPADPAASPVSMKPSSCLATVSPSHFVHGRAPRKRKRNESGRHSPLVSVTASRTPSVPWSSAISLRSRTATPYRLSSWIR